MSGYRGSDPSVRAILTAWESLYQPLLTRTSTRLLTLLSGSGDSDIQASLKEVDLKRSPKYEAVSYTWGSEADYETIYVNGCVVEI